jgi:hypothetical protein
VYGQDAYGSTLDVDRVDYGFPILGLSVGRIGETAAEAKIIVDAYLSTNGGVTPLTTRPLITGFDFMADGAQAVGNEFSQGMCASGTTCTLATQDSAAVTSGGTTTTYQLVKPYVLPGQQDTGPAPWTAQALKTDAGEKKSEPAAEEAKLEGSRPEPQRTRMPQERESITHKFRIGMQEGYITAGKYPDGSVGEIFLTDIGKEGSTIKGLMNAFATAISIGLQYGVPLEDFVRKFSYMRFEPEGITTNPEIPFAKSMPDYIMRWLASRFIEDTNYLEQLGIMTDEVRAKKEAQQAFPIEDTAAPSNGGNGNGSSNGESKSNGEAKPATAALTDTPPVIPAKIGADLELGPACDQCGGMMQRTGSCYTCPSCGNNTGCG